MMIASVVLLTILLLVHMWTATGDGLATSFEDDAFYYFGTARNIASTGISTFDGTTVTNGYHPLWMAVILPAFLVSDDPLLPLRIAGSISILLMSAGTLVGTIAMTRRHPPLVSALCTFLMLRYLRDFSSMAMETSVLIPLCIAALIQADSLKRGRSRPGGYLILGVLLLLILLSRLDAIVLVILLGAAVLSGIPAGSTRRRAFPAVTMPSLFGIIAYLACNRLTTGLLLPVSGALKSSFLTFNGLFARQLFLLSDPLRLRSPWGLYLLYLILSIAFLRMTAMSRARQAGHPPKRGRGRPGPVDLVIPALMIAHAAIYLFNSTWRLWYWYAWPAVLFTVFTLPGILSGVWRYASGRYPSPGGLRIRGAVHAASAALLIPCSIYWGLKHGNPSPGDFRYRNLIVARQLNDELAPGSVIAMGDCAESFSWFFDGRVIQLEGLMGDKEMLEAIQAGDLERYVIVRAPDYLLSHTGPEGIVEYGEWGLLYPDRAQSTGPQDTIFVNSDDEVHRWESEEGCIFLWRL